VAKINSLALAAGDTVSFQRGGTWRETLIPVGSGTSAAPITITAYGSGALPILSGANVVTGWTAHATGTAGTYKAALAASTSMVTSSNQYLVRKTAADTLAAGEYFWDSATGTLYINDGAGDPATSGRVIEAAQRGSVISVNANRDYIVIDSLRLEKTNNPIILTSAGAERWTVQNCELFFGRAVGPYAGAGMHLDGNAHCKILNNRISYVQGDGIFFYRAAGGEFRGNNIDQIKDQGGNGGPDGIQLLGSSTAPLNGFIIADNIVTRESSDTTKGCIIVETGGNGLISGNTCIKGRFGIAIYVNDTIVERNYLRSIGTNDALRMWENRGQTNITIRYNIVNGCGTNGLSVGTSSQTAKNVVNLRVYNNLFHGTFYGVQMAVPVSGEFKNNIVWNTGTSNPRTRLGISSIIPGQTFVTNHNIYNDTGSERLIGWLGTSYYDLASFQTATGQDLNSSTANPQFVDIWTANFRVQPTSPAIDAGTDVGLTSDYDGNPVPSGTAPDIGAYELQVDPPGPDVYEGFDYAAGDLNGANGGVGWSGAWTVNTATNAVETTGYTYPNLPVSGGRWHFWTTTSTSANGTRALANSLGANDTTRWILFIGKKDSTNRDFTVSFSGLAFKTQGVGNWTVKTPNTPAVATAATASSQALFLVRMDFAATQDVAYVWINPTLGSSAPAASTANITLTDPGFNITGISTSIGPFGNSSQGARLDEIAIGQSYESLLTP
jgi:parallel beta-helix repeat protein